MTAEQKAAFIIAQAALVMAKIAGMTAANQYHAALGHIPQYGEADFVVAANEGVLGWNPVISFFQE